MEFRFSLDPVLKVRIHQEKLLKQKLAAEVQKQEQIRGVRQEAQEKLTHYLDVSNRSDASRIHDMKRHGSHMEQVHDLIMKLEKELDESENLVLQKREKLAEAHKNRHILEKVREGELELHRKRIDQMEQKSNDEIATQLFGRSEQAHQRNE